MAGREEENMMRKPAVEKVFAPHPQFVASAVVLFPALAVCETLTMVPKSFVSNIIF